MHTVLFAWELGAGTGHIRNLRHLAARLGSRARRVALIASSVAARELEQDGIEVRQAPPWPLHSRTAAERAKGSSATFAESLAAAGMADENALQSLLRAWDRLFAEIQPDVVVAEYAPAATLAARGRVPLILVGNGFSLPPSEMQAFPLLHRVSPPVWTEDTLLAIVNRALASLRRQPLERLPALFAGDARLVLSFPLLDPYAEQRVEPPDGPIIDWVPNPRRSDAEKIFVYLAGGAALRPELFAALLPLAPKLRMHAPAFSQAQLEQLARAGAQVDSAPTPLATALPSARLAVHLGGSGVASAALAVGVPQLVLCTHIESELTGQALERAGVGKNLKHFDPASRITTEMISDLVDDEVVARKAAALAGPHREILARSDPLGKFERAVRDLLPG